MKILLINTNYGGGAGIACRRLHTALLANGYDSSLLVLDKVISPAEKNVYSIQEIISKKQSAGYFILLKFINRVFNKIPTLLNKKAYINGPSSLFRIDQLAVYKQSDIIHLHWVPKIISYNHIFADKKKVFFWTLHDMNPFTGGNHYTTDLDYTPFKKLLQKNSDKKKKYLKDVDLTVISPSSWLAGIAKESEVFRDFAVHHIPNCINTSIFKPLDKIQTREKLNINFSGKTFILFVAEDPDDRRKGMHLLLTALKQLKNKNQFCLLIAGKKIEISDIDIQIIQMGFIKKETDLVNCYNAADFFVNPSVEDNFPNTILESLSCGAPVLAFDTGGIPDLIQHQQNGYLADEISPENLLKGINWLVENHTNKALQQHARNKVFNNYTYDNVIQQHVQLYELSSGGTTGLVTTDFSPLKKISIITVVFNGKALIERTIKSVLSQTYPDIEYIIIDGGSSDGTLDIVQSYKSGISKIISEKDNGIYDAMNKGLSLATGNYVLFLNAGDEFVSKDTLAKVFSVSAGADVYYGNTAIVNEKAESLGERRLRPPPVLTWKSLKYGMCVSHQSFIAKLTLCEPYNLDFKISSDIDWVINVLKKSNKIVNTHLYISNYLKGGASDKHRPAALIERFKIMVKYYGFFQTVWNHLYIALRYLFHKLTRKSTA